jgi:hypothetical protein
MKVFRDVNAVSVGKQIPGISKCRSAVIFMVKTIRSFKTLANIYPATHHNTQVDLNLQEDNCENSNLAFFRAGITYITDHELFSYKRKRNLAYRPKFLNGSCLNGAKWKRHKMLFTLQSKM